jgi:hypothetical protein
VADYSQIQIFDLNDNAIGNYPNFNQVQALALGPDGLIYGAEGAGDVRVFDPTGTMAATINGFNAALNGVWVDENGDVYAAGQTLSAYGIALVAKRLNALSENPPLFDAPQVLALQGGPALLNLYGVMKTGSRLYLADINLGLVLGFDQQAGSVTYSFGTTVVAQGDGPGQVRGPGLMARDALGRVYLTSAGDGRFEIFNSSFTQEIYECDPTGPYSGAGIAMDGDGNVYLSGIGLNKIQGCIPFQSYAGPDPPPADECFIYPSPARGNQASVAYAMSQIGNMRMEVWNQNGEWVARVTDRKTAGTQSTPFDISRFAPGVYFYSVTLSYDSGQVTRMKTGKFVVTH